MAAVEPLSMVPASDGRRGGRADVDADRRSRLTTAPPAAAAAAAAATTADAADASIAVAAPCWLAARSRGTSSVVAGTSLPVSDLREMTFEERERRSDVAARRRAAAAAAPSPAGDPRPAASASSSLAENESRDADDCGDAAGGDGDELGGDDGDASGSPTGGGSAAAPGGEAITFATTVPVTAGGATPVATLAPAGACGGRCSSNAG